MQAVLVFLGQWHSFLNPIPSALWQKKFLPETCKLFTRSHSFQIVHLCLFFFISWGSFQWEGGRLNTAGKLPTQSKTQSSTIKTFTRPFPGLNLDGTLELVCQLSQPDVKSVHKNFVFRHQLSFKPDAEETLRLFPVM